MSQNQVVKCPSCQKKLRIPTGKHIKFKCPKCGTQNEFDGIVKTAKKKTSPFIYVGIALLISFGIKYCNRIVKTGDSNQIRTSGENHQSENLNKLVEAVDINDPITNDFGVRLASKFPGKFNVGQICSVFDYLVHDWKYVNDSRRNENFRSASRSIKNGLAGDCDDFTIVMAAMIESIGGTSRISFAYGDNSAHAFCEVYVVSNENDMEDIVSQIATIYNRYDFDVNYSIDSEGGCWLNLDWFGNPRLPGGKYFNYNTRTIYYPTAATPYFVNE